MMKGILMRIGRILPLAFVAMTVFLAHPAQAQDFLIHLRRQGDTVSIKNAPVTIDHVIETKADSNGIARIPDLEAGGHILEATAPAGGYGVDQECARHHRSRDRDQ